MTQPFRFSVSLGGMNADDITANARRAEELGYSAITLADHFTDQPAPLIALTAAALATTTIRIMPLVLANDYREPLVLAKELATLDAFSGGRLNLGIGAGWMEADYEASGIVLDSPGTRIRRLRESVGILRTLLSGGEVTDHGEFYNVKGSLTAPLPAQENGLPLMLAGGKQKMLTLAGELADIVGFNPGLTAGVIDTRAGRTATAEKTDEKLSWVREGAGTRFDSIELQTRLHLSAVTSDQSAAAAEFAPLVGLSTEEALESPHVLVGTVEQNIEQIQRWRERWGISFISVRSDDLEPFAPIVEALHGT